MWGSTGNNIIIIVIICAGASIDIDFHYEVAAIDAETDPWR